MHVFAYILAPSPPLNVRVVQSGERNLFVTWDLPLEPNGILKPFDVTCIDGITHPFPESTPSGDSTSLEVSVTNHEKMYTCTVEASVEKVEGMDMFTHLESESDPSEAVAMSNSPGWCNLNLPFHLNDYLYPHQ